MWIDGWREGGRDGWMDGWMDGCIAALTHSLTRCSPLEWESSDRRVACPAAEAGGRREGRRVERGASYLWWVVHDGVSCHLVGGHRAVPCM